MTSARRIRVVVPSDRKVQLPADVPEGDAEVIVLFEAAARGPSPLLPRRGEGLDRALFAHPEAALDALTPDEASLWEDGDLGPKSS